MLFRDLEYFLVLSEHRHFGRAADALGLSQPALSKSVRRLEEFAETALCERSARGMTLTPAGRVLIERARLILRDAGRAFEEVKSVHGELKGTVKIGAIPTVCETFLPAALQRLRQARTGVTASVMSNWNQSLFAMLDAGEVDLIITGLKEPSNNSRYNCQPLFHDRVSVVCRAGHPLDLKKPASLKEVQKFEWVLASATSAGRQWLDETFSAHKLPRPRVAIESDSLILAKELVAASNLLGFLPRLVVAGDIASGRLRPVGTRAGIEWNRTIYMLTLSKPPLSVSARLLISYLRDVARTIRPGN
ncbi:MAG TPA: LysR family transcriptional regulator [Pseudolabrys sp.]|nr:LysR family transcriptional regulator [Pseudolabrys sp.]